MTRILTLGLLTSLALAGAAQAQPKAQNLSAIETIVVIYAENRSFDNLYGLFPGANGVRQAKPAPQKDRDGSALPALPPVWCGVAPTDKCDPARTTHLNLPNKPFAIDDPKGLNLGLAVPTRDLWHRFYQNQMQINGGRNDLFTAWSDAGGLAMGYYDGSRLPMWKVAQRFVLADSFFMGAFGGSFLNHFWLVCACTPYYPNADKTEARANLSEVIDGTVTLVSAGPAGSAMKDPPRFKADGSLTPDFFAVNTIQPPYQPSRVAPAAGGDPALADPKNKDTLVPQTADTIGSRLDDANVKWAWYAGAWKAALDGNRDRTYPNFVTHHQPFNYFSRYAPGTKEREEHLRDGGLDGKAFLDEIRDGKLPPVTFYKPQGSLNEHPGYTDVMSGDKHIADVVDRLLNGPQGKRMLVIVTYDENGGFWDHVAPPMADRWGPATRVPTIIAGPFARHGVVDHTQYDTTSIIRLISRRHNLKPLPGITERDEALRKKRQKPIGDLTAALTVR